MTIADKLKEEGKREGKREGKLEGKLEGKREVTRRIVKNAIIKRMSMEDIIDITGLTEKEIDEISKDLLEK